MKIFKYVLLLCLFTGNLCSINAQESRKLLTDSTCIFGVLKQGFISTTLDIFCLVQAQKYISESKTVVVQGVYKCTDSYNPSKSKYLVEILLGYKGYYVDKDKIFLEDESFYEKYEQFSESEKKRFRENAGLTVQILEREKLDNLSKFAKKCSLKGLCIVDWNIYDESEYTDGTSLKIRILNPTKKTIKYLWFTYVGYNPVHDKVFDRIKGGSSIVLKAVGPVEYDATGTYEFDYAWHTDLVETAKLLQVKVQYMDGSIKIITDPDSIRMTSEMVETLEKDE